MNTHTKFPDPDKTSTSLEYAQLGENDRLNIQNEFLKLKAPYSQPELFSVGSLKGITQMPTDILQQIQHFALDEHSPGAMLIKNLPIDPELPATPAEGPYENDKRNYVGEAVAMGLGKLLGEPIGYKTEKDGDILHNLIPSRGAETTQSNRGSETFLNFHNDCVYDEGLWFHRYNADFLVLYGQRPDANNDASTIFIDAQTICQVLDRQEVEELRRPNFKLAAPSNFTELLNDGKKIWSKPGPIISGPVEAPEIAIAANGVRGLNEKADHALKRLQETCADPDFHISVKLQSGNALLINNRKGLHARSSFKPTFGPNERWLIRANVRRDIWSMRDRSTDKWRAFH